MLRTVYNILRMPPVKRKSSLKRLSVLDRIRMSISFRILTTLKKRYEAYAFSDEIRVASGNEILKFEFRDLTFEKELSEQGLILELHPSMHPRRDIYMSPSTKQTSKSPNRDFDCICSLTIKRVIIAKPSADTNKKEKRKQPLGTKPPRRVIVPVNSLLTEPVEEHGTEHIQGAEADNSF